MIKTLRITSVAAVVLAVVVLASVLGYLRPASLIHLSVGTGGDKQIENVLSGPGAVERFKTLYGSKVPNSEDTTPPLIKQAELLADIINPPASPDTPPKLPSQLPPKPSLSPKPPVAVSGKFDLLGTCYSSNPKASYAYIQLPDNTCQWVGLGTEIGHGTIKEIRKGAIVYWDGSRNIEINVVPTPETSSLLETGKAPKEVSPLKPLVSSETQSPAKAPTLKPQTSSSAKALNGPAKPPVASGRPVVPTTPLPSAQIGKEEQEKLSRLGDQLTNGAGAEAVDRDARANKMISEYKSGRILPPGIQKQGNPGEPNVTASAARQSDASAEASKDPSRSPYNPFKKRLSLPRSMKK
jgi:hypothetical protein